MQQRTRRALAICHHQFELIEKYSYDPVNGGYFETFERDWTIARDQRLSDVDMDEKKSMNTHLHVMEGYACCCRCGRMARCGIGFAN